MNTSIRSSMTSYWAYGINFKWLVVSLSEHGPILYIHMYTYIQERSNLTYLVSINDDVYSTTSFMIAIVQINPARLLSVEFVVQATRSDSACNCYYIFTNQKQLREKERERCILSPLESILSRLAGPTYSLLVRCSPSFPVSALLPLFCVYGRFCARAPM